MVDHIALNKLTDSWKKERDERKWTFRIHLFVGSPLKGLIHLSSLSLADCSYLFELC